MREWYDVYSMIYNKVGKICEKEKKKNEGCEVTQHSTCYWSRKQTNIFTMIFFDVASDILLIN